MPEKHKKQETSHHLWQSHDQEQSKWNTAITRNSGIHTLKVDRIIKIPFNENNVAIIKSILNSNKNLFKRACQIRAMVPI